MAVERKQSKQKVEWEMGLIVVYYVRKLVVPTRSMRCLASQELSLKPTTKEVCCAAR